MLRVSVVECVCAVLGCAAQTCCQAGAPPERARNLTAALHRLRPAPAPARRRVNSSDALAAVEQLHSPLSTGRATAAGQHGRSIFAASPRDGHAGIELSAVVAVGAPGAGSNRASGASTPLAGGAGAAAAGLAKKHTGAAGGDRDGSVAETALLLDRGHDGGGGASSVHQRASATGGSSSSTPNGLTQLGAFAASVRSRLVT